jgi:hypothetical protein
MKCTFSEVAVKGTKRWTEDGKRKYKTKKFFQTINPFNKNADGTQKSREQILEEINKEKNDWLAE